MKTKKLLKLAVAFIVALSVLLPFAFNAVNAANSTATVNAITLNVREKPSTSSKKLGSLKRNKSYCS
ncbi:SH3 domain-containing protein [Pseudobacillus wudalianchiensis]|uniref:Uncharacterized protein n=1 Tax=Pseudobacillus wudalianchiensis TaxID=1743143 RepID=A0A1B9AND0_9BACI|nr:SH3 domain-containing protein [Bacillus wudalianchiensis]OCA85281.1 hypothetical protein A8F95_11460 [Bacillus wudalianchiensis]